jgi:hypothetical protein
VVLQAVERRDGVNEKANWPRWGLPVGIAAAVTVLVIVALVRDPVLLDPDSPEGTVQEYLQAISEERWEDAYAVLDEERFAGCSAADVASNAPGEPFTASLAAGDGSAVVERFEEVGEEGPPTTTTPPDEETVVEVTLRFGESGPLGGGWTTHEVFEVVSREGFWWISGDPWPYFSWRCQ